MKAGYHYIRERCPTCGKEIAFNWYIRHWKRDHADILEARKRRRERLEKLRRGVGAATWQPG